MTGVGNSEAAATVRHAPAAGLAENTAADCCPGLSALRDAGAEQLNQSCFCVATDVMAVARRIDQTLSTFGPLTPIAESHPHLFAHAPVFVNRATVRHMAAVARAVTDVAALPGYIGAALADAPGIAHRDPGAGGVLLGFDFHLGPDGPLLIEINTNAGGVLLNAALCRAQRTCCTAVANRLDSPNDADIEARIAAMFETEWQIVAGDRPLERLAIVDSQPEGQYLFPEFALFADLFRARGIDARIVDPSELSWLPAAAPGRGESRGYLAHRGDRIDLVYNRLTDFYLDDPAHAALRRAWQDGAVLFPNPHEHALYANKHNLARLSSREQLLLWGAEPDTTELLCGSIPRTVPVEAAQAEALWADRDHLFFKPARGYGSRGAYRGDKITRGAFSRLLADDYVAQQLVPPGRRLGDPTDATALKFDLRLYTHGGDPLLVAARLYQGQTTNFRTPGGGFAPVYFSD